MRKTKLKLFLLAFTTNARERKMRYIDRKSMRKRNAKDILCILSLRERVKKKKN
jgi:hypothetical protein